MRHRSAPRRAQDRRRPRPVAAAGSRPPARRPRSGRASLLLATLVVALLAGPVAAQVALAPDVGAEPGPPTVVGLYLDAGPANGGGTFIWGTGFTGATSVTFGDQPAVAFTVQNDTLISAIAPPSPVPPAPEVVVDVVITTPLGTNEPSSVAQFHYWAPPVVTVVTPDPAAGPLVSSTEGGQLPTLDVANVNGTVRGATVDGVSTNIWAGLEPGRFQLETPPHPAGPAELVVEGVGGSSAPVPITYVDTPRPRVQAAVPANGPVTGGTTVVLTGTALTDTTQVSFGSTLAPSFTVDSDTQLTVVTPAVDRFGEQTVDVTTTVGHTPWDGTVGFTYDGPPVVDGLVPDHGPTAGGFHTFLWGEGLERTTGVWFGDQPALSWSWSSDTYWLTAVAPPHAAGAVPVTVDSADGRSREGVTYTYDDAGGPVIESITPFHGPQGGGNTVTLTGSGFTGTTAVGIGYEGFTTAAFTVVDDGTIQVTMPPWPWGETVPITVIGPVGSNNPTPRTVYQYDPVPVVYSLDPSVGPPEGGTSVNVYGDGLEWATAVRIGGTSVPFTWNAELGALQVVTPPHAPGAAVVVVDAASGSSDPTPTSINSFLYNTAGVPVVQSFGPTEGSELGGTVVKIFGTDLDAVTDVLFGGTPATSWEHTTWFGTPTIDAVAPPHAPGPTDVVLRTAAGDSIPRVDQPFTYLAQPPPAVAYVSPNRGPVEGGSAITVIGSGFLGATAVTIGGVAATSFDVVDDTTITAVVPPAADQVVDTTVPVAVTTPLGTSGPADANSSYTYVVALPPTITSLDAREGPIAGGTVVPVRGAGFTGATAVRFGTHDATFDIVNDGLLYAHAPAVEAPFLYNVSVTTPRGTSPSSAASWFAYRGKPVVWSVQANTGSVLGGETVTIKGDQLLHAWGVAFGWNLTYDFTVVDQHTIVARVPACSAGTVWVKVGTPLGDSDVTLGSLYTYRDPGAPVVSSVAANHGSTAGGETVVLTGSGFTGTTGVRFGTTAATSFTVDSDTQITAVAPARAAPALVNVFVDGPSGANASGPASWYRYDP